MKIISRKEAKERGLKRYFTGKPCKNGHVSERYVGSGCVECYNKYQRDYHKQWLENNSEYSKQHRQDNKERYKEYNKQYRENNPEYDKQWRQDNKERYKEYNKRYQENNKEKIN